MREQGQETGRDASLITVGGKNRAPREEPSPAPPPRGPAPRHTPDRVGDLRARLLAGEYDIPALLVADCMIARALDLSPSVPATPRGVIRRPDPRPSDDAA